MKKLLVLSVLLMLTFAVGCRPGTPVVNVQSVPVSTLSMKQASMEEVRKAIIGGGSITGWHMREITSGLLEASITVRGKHHVVVEIPYSTQSYSIIYKSSTNMEYNAAKGSIHPNYNNWVNTLRQNIDKQIDLLHM